jgi:hypothetical protein
MSSCTHVMQKFSRVRWPSCQPQMLSFVQLPVPTSVPSTPTSSTLSLLFPPRPCLYYKTLHAARRRPSQCGSGVLTTEIRILNTLLTILIFWDCLLHDKFPYLNSFSFNCCNRCLRTKLLPQVPITCDVISTL